MAATTRYLGLSARLIAGLIVLAPGLGVSGDAPSRPAADPHYRPYRADADPRKDLADAEQRAAQANHLVMVIFGANWCPDCLVLHKNLEQGATMEYAQQHFEVVSVDVGDLNKNLKVADDLGVTLKKGIPVAAILEGGKVIATTNRGELESSRHYSAQQILGFMQEIVDNRRVVFPAGEH
jgi:thiol-disulfide isomerase/thioredoxin